jgi:hypothetical protein
MRSLRRVALRLASAFLIFSPVYSDIFLPPLKWATEKQPRPSIFDSLMDKPGASLSLIPINLIHLFCWVIAGLTVECNIRAFDLEGAFYIRNSLAQCLIEGAWQNKLAASVFNVAANRNRKQSNYLS